MDHVAQNIRLTGFPRYRELLERDYKRFFLIGLITLMGFLPFAAGVWLAIMSSSVLILLPACLVGGLAAGPALSGMYDAVLRSLRDAPGSWWLNYRKAIKQNWRDAMLPGVFLCLFLGFTIFTGMLLWWAGSPPSPSSLVLLFLSALLFTAIYSTFWPQLVLFRQKNSLRLKNSILFLLQNFWRTLGTALLQVLWWTLFVLFLPWTAFLIPFLSVWFILFVSCFLLYIQLDEAFSIEALTGSAAAQPSPKPEV